MIEVFACRTESGSMYTLARDADGRFWLTAKNVPNPGSYAIPGDAVYPVSLASAWPPVVGRGLKIYSLRLDGHPELPQGAYFTSAVEEVTASAMDDQKEEAA